MVDITSPYEQGWYDPATEEVIPNDHVLYYQYNITDIPEPFIQHQGEIYWLELCMEVADPENTRWGWKSSEDHWNDDAVWRGEDWQDLFEPGDPITDWFAVGINPDGTFNWGGGSGYNNGEWYYYPDTGWWNQWFYDHPFDPERDKVIYIVIDLVELEPDLPSYIEFAVNYSMPEWSELGHGEDYPPIPGAPGFIEELHIVRDTLLEGEVIEDFYEFRYVIRDYNPEWVSIDVRGYNFWIGDGHITHECVQSLDLAFVITGEPECPGDIDGDGDTDHSDLGELLAAWCTHPGDPNWNPNADLDGDGHVGHGDLGILLADWGCGTGP